MTAHDHHHDHHHGHAHTHAPANFDRAFAVGTALNAAFVAVQVFYGLAAHSMALLADAVHNFGDVLGLLIAWGAAWLGRRRPHGQRTYGWGRTSILASLTNAVVLLLGCGAIALEAVQRFADPAPVAGRVVTWVALLGIAVNGGTALMFMRGRKGDLNIRAAFLHLASDAAVSGAVVIAGLVIAATGWVWLDPVTSLGIVAVITLGTWGLLRDSVNLAIDAAPKAIRISDVEHCLRDMAGVTEVHDLHVWGLSTTETALTAHLVRTPGGDVDVLLRQACAEMQRRFGIGHATFQIETAETATLCRLRPAHVI